MVSKIRLESLVWATVNYLILLLCVIFYLWIFFFSSCNEVQFTLLLISLLSGSLRFIKNSKWIIMTNNIKFNELLLILLRPNWLKE
jgi:hypothetical protein